MEAEAGVGWANLETEKPLRGLLCKFVELTGLFAESLGAVLAKAGRGKRTRGTDDTSVTSDWESQGRGDLLPD